ncbi:hypothetical protein PTKU64_86610 [Paraburkholderia terrae]|uniref:Uncharacterized protein n=1 Tax=Paraburkholderia terrae TaxID=311230 RepID=A0ABM7U0X8_9BURK|nr:hypothetical protein PTKU64_86610 [Paraburkholderia terrae]BDC44948.1 hypothetical protein PTKU15_82450 [Paraburkholderia terrae]
MEQSGGDAREAAMKLKTGWLETCIDADGICVRIKEKLRGYIASFVWRSRECAAAGRAA